MIQGRGGGEESAWRTKGVGKECVGEGFMSRVNDKSWSLGPETSIEIETISTLPCVFFCMKSPIS
jgi:hypothetical protein